MSNHETSVQQVELPDLYYIRTCLFADIKVVLNCLYPFYSGVGSLPYFSDDDEDSGDSSSQDDKSEGEESEENDADFGGLLEEQLERRTSTSMMQ